MTREPHPEYSRCGLPHVVSNTVRSLESLISHPPDFYEHFNKINLLLNTEAYEADSSKKTLKTRNLKTGEQRVLEYDSIILATGAEATLLPIKGVEKKGVFVVRILDDIASMTKHLEASPLKTVVIVGAGLIGMEMAEALASKGYRPVVVELLPAILPAMLDSDMASVITEKATEHGIRILTGVTVDEIAGKEKVQSVMVKGERIETETVIIAARVKPNVELAKQIGVAIGDTGGIKVNEYMLTSNDYVYAAGDCVETKDLVSGRNILIQLATVAVRHGFVAGVNAAGGSDKFLGSTGVCTTKLFSYEISAAGLTTAFAEKLGLSSLSAKVTASTRLPYFPNAKNLMVKLLAEKKDGRLIGSQIIGEEGAALRANLVALALQMKLSVNEFGKIETCYAPPVAPVWDPLTLAAQALQRKFELAISKVGS